MTHGIATAGGGHGWETGVVAALSNPAAGFTVVRRCADVADVLATAATGQISACLLTADLRGFDSETVHQLAGFGVMVVAVHRVDDARRALSLDRIGVFGALADDSSPAAMVALLRRAVDPNDDVPAADEITADDGRRVDRRPGGDPSANVAGDAATSRRDTGPSSAGRDDDDTTATGAAPKRSALTARNVAGASASVAAGSASTGTTPRGRHAHPRGTAGRSDDEPHGGERRAGRVVAVWGPMGAPGRTTVAMGLADRAADQGRTTLLVDADVYGGVLASAFGLLDESAGLAGACRLATNGRLTEPGLAELCWKIDGRRTVLTGIARADRWPELRPSTIPTVLELARQLADLVIVDCSALLERDEEITFDTMAPRRNGATLAAIEAADVVLAVGAGDPPGMERLARGYGELVAAVDGVAPLLVLNRVRSTAASKSELAEASRRFCGVDPVAFLPEDRSGCDQAWRRGMTLTGAAPKSPLNAALDALVRAATERKLQRA